MNRCWEDRDLPTLKRDLAIRLQVLDPTGRFRKSSHHSVSHFLGENAYDPPPPGRVLTITYAVGGAGAQTHIGINLMKSLKKKLLAGEVRLNLVAGVRDDTRDIFEQAHQEILSSDNSVTILYRDNHNDYFDAFNEMIRTTDILWTKPSELSFSHGFRFADHHSTEDRIAGEVQP